MTTPQEARYPPCLRVAVSKFVTPHHKWSGRSPELIKRYIGASLGCSNNVCLYRGFVGQIANIQVYNTSLTANEITALYDEGIGGVPLNLNSLVGWWPLNGNRSDYIGNLNNGVSMNVVYTNSWACSYSAP